MNPRNNKGPKNQKTQSKLILNLGHQKTKEHKEAKEQNKSKTIKTKENAKEKQNQEVND
ncbi:hypothetical protein M9Y10_005836 [Tritrichomonas musculus]|uniref:Uncharacterized protein n=1 Tax=Tritrichomonas musculus TaxID=1915356 RepID=A0ABR2JEU3_9EUKA